jgi:hypothetical protein
MFSAKNDVLSSKEKAVVQTMVMKLQPTEALNYLHECGVKIGKRTYYYYKKKVESLKWERLIQVANLFTFKKSCILEKIANVQPFISNYYDAIRFVLKSRLKTDVIAGTQSKPQFENKFTYEEQKTIKRMTPFSGSEKYDV